LEAARIRNRTSKPTVALAGRTRFKNPASVGTHACRVHEKGAQTGDETLSGPNYCRGCYEFADWLAIAFIVKTGQLAPRTIWWATDQGK